MKILQLNIWTGRLLSPALDLLAKERPDIVCLQEAISYPGSTAGLVGTIQELQEALGLEHMFFSPFIGFNLMRRRAEFGNCILSTKPFVATKSIFTSKKYVEDFDVNEDDYNIRNLQHITLHLNTSPLHILNHHGHHVPQHKNGNDETLRACRLIADYIQTLKGKIILTGDFNLTPHSQSLEQINAVLNNACIQFNISSTRTPLTKKTEVCDYIFTNDQVQIKHFKVAEELVSDHKALIMEFE